MMRKSSLLVAALASAAIYLISGCTLRTEQVEIDGQDVELVIVHTADIHSRLLPYELDVGLTDEALGLLDENAPYGGIARLAAFAQQERRNNERYLHLDTGDVFQGAPVFNFFGGEPEFRVYTHLGIDAMTIGNHEFDNGASAVVQKALQYVRFPMLAANYIYEPSQMEFNAPTSIIGGSYVIRNVKGLKVGIIGMGSTSSISSLLKGKNSLGLKPLNTVETLQFYIDFLRPQVDLVVLIGHLGYHDDLEFIPQLEGLDVALDGHLHITLSPPAVLQDCDIAKLRRERDRYVCDSEEKLTKAATECEYKDDCDGKPGSEAAACKVACRKEAEEACDKKEINYRYAERRGELEHAIANLQKRGCHPRDVLLVHSGAFLKYVAKLNLTLRQCPRLEQQKVCAEEDEGGNCLRWVKRRCSGRGEGKHDWEVIAYDHMLTPMDKNMPDDPAVLQILEPYVFELNRQQDLTEMLGYTANRVRRFSTGSGDSQLGNLVADAMRLRNQVWADFAITNSLGIRSDLVTGPISREQMTNVFPFENSITVMYLSGYEVQEMMDFVTQRSTARGCQSQAQVSGITAKLNCAGCAGDGGNSCIRELYTGDACAQRVTIGGTGSACEDDGDCLNGEICTKQTHPIEEGKFRCWQPIACNRTYRLATNDYIARGGSGFSVLARNTTQQDLKIPLRQAAVDFITSSPSCSEKTRPTLFGAREYVINKDDEALVKQLEKLVLDGNWQQANAEFANFRTRLLARQSQSSDNDVKAGYTNYLACIQDCPSGSKASCRGLAATQIGWCNDFKVKDKNRCEALARVHAAIRCITLSCVKASEDGRLQRQFPAGGGSLQDPDPYPD